MTVGIVILGIVAVLLFFGAAERYFDRLGMTSWLTFLIVLALIIGAVMPEVRAERFVMTVGGFVVPTVVFILIFVLSVRGGSNALRILVALAAVGAIVTAFRLLTGIATTGALTAFFLLSGVIGGAVAMAAAGTRTGSLAAVLGGCVAGDAVSMAILRGAYGQTVYTLGGYGIFNAMIVGCAAALLLAEIVAAVRRGVEDRRTAASKLTAEAAKDEGLGESADSGDHARAGAEAARGEGMGADAEDAELGDLPPQSDDDIIGGD